jgi:pimeloyl-ACP methyl ester carboxylesterase
MPEPIPSVDSATRVPYDEFSLFHENAAEWGLPFTAPPEVRRTAVEMSDGREVSALVWGHAEPEYVFIHGGAQNAHTWDTVLLALGRPAVALDLPGHGHSDGPRRAELDVEDLAADVASAIRVLAPEAKAVVGMSLGGLTTVALGAIAPDLVRSVVLVDVTPGVDRDRTGAITAFINGPRTFPDFDSLLARTIEHNPSRSESSLRRGILHNAVQNEDGTWQWRYARHRVLGGDRDLAPDRFAPLWDQLGALQVPLMLVRGMRAQSVVDDASEAELLRRLPTATVVHVEGAGHSVQGDAPLELAALVARFTSA